MKQTLIIDRSLLQRVVAGVDTVVPRTAKMLPVCGLLQLTCGGGSMRITGTDTLAWLTGEIPLEADIAAVAIVDAEKFVGAVSNAATPTVSLTFESKPERLLVKYGNSTFRLQSVASTTQFPPPSGTIDARFPVVLPGAKLAKAIKKVSFAAASGDIRAYLNGIAFQGNGDQLTIVGTNGHRLAKTVVQLAEPMPSAENAIVPREMVNALLRLCEADSVELRFGSKLFVTADVFKGYLPLLEGSYPDWRRVIPTNYPSTLKLNRQALLSALRRTSFCLTAASQGIELNINPVVNTMKLVSRDGSDNAIEDEVDFTGDGLPSESVRYGVSATYLQEAVNAVESTDVTLRFNDPNTSLVVMDEKESEWVAIIMPMRL